jgi:hypothetical protein
MEQVDVNITVRCTSLFVTSVCATNIDAALQLAVLTDI